MQRRPLWLIILVTLISVVVLRTRSPKSDTSTISDAPTVTAAAPAANQPATGSEPPSDVDAAFAAHASNQIVTATGVVQRVLPDDTQGLQHQRFVLRMPSGLTVLIAHDIDEAPRVADLQAGVALSAHGEYVWKQQGGIVHWTHHDSSGRHAPGWIDYQGQRYQ